MKLVIAADHGGLELKDELFQRLQNAGVEIEDLGTYEPDSVDYPEFAFMAAKALADGHADRAIVVCGTGIGISIAANKVKGILCAKVNSVEEGKLAAEHNHANMLAFGGRTTDVDTAFEAVQAWLATPFAGDRHERRVNIIKDYDHDR